MKPEHKETAWHTATLPLLSSPSLRRSDCSHGAGSRSELSSWKWPLSDPSSSSSSIQTCLCMNAVSQANLENNFMSAHYPWYDQRATTPLHLRLLQQIKINLENSPALHPHNASSSLLTRFFTNPHTHQERQLTTPAFSVAVVSLQPGVVGSWLLEQAGFRYINVFQHWVIQSYFLLLHQSVCVYWVSPIKYLSNKVTLKYKMPWFDLTDFWEYPQKGQVRSEASWLFPTIYYCLLLYLTSSSSTGLIQTNQTENDNVFCLY